MLFSPSVKELVPPVLKGLNPLDPVASQTAAPLRNLLNSCASSEAWLCGPGIPAMLKLFTDKIALLGSPQLGLGDTAIPQWPLELTVA